jgi:hypothetical protein
MAYLYLRRNGRAEIREAHNTSRGPRSRTLASFRGELTEELLDRAESAAARPFDRDALRRRAVAQGLPVRRERPGADAAARALLGQLRSGGLDPLLAGVLRDQLDALPRAPVPSELADVVEWIGASDRERGLALRDVLRLYDTIARSRESVPEAEAARFPRFRVRPERRAS